MQYPTYPKKKIIFVVLFACMITMLCASGITKNLTLENIKIYRDTLTAYVTNHYTTSVALFITIYIASVLTLLPVVMMLSILSGFLFGLVPGTTYAVISATVGSSIAFLGIKYFLVGNGVQRHLQHFKLLKAATDTYGAQALLVIRFLPFIPFFIINLVAPFLRISAFTFVWTTCIGIIPETLMYAWAGSHLLHINSTSEILTPQYIAVFILLALLALSSLLLQRHSSAITHKLEQR